MLEICLLGTGAMMPMPERRLASLLVRRNGRLLLIDCGEGTQVAVRLSGWSLARIDTICLTHFHADHVAGLPGLLLTMGTSGRTEPVTLIGPPGLAFVLQHLCVIAPRLPYPLWVTELDEPLHALTFHDTRLTCFALDHIMPCYGYAIELDRPGKFLPERAKALGIGVAHWGALQRGERVETPDGTFTPDMVMGPPRKGIKLAYCTDTRPCESIVQHARSADLLICEGTYGEGAKADKAAGYGHMTFTQAATLAKRADARGLLLTHFSPSMPAPETQLDAARSVFGNSDIGQDGMMRALHFEA